IIATGFQQQNAHSRVFGEAARNHRAGRARSADDKVIVRLQLGAEFLLIDANTLGEIFDSGAILEFVFEPELFFGIHVFFLSLTVRLRLLLEATLRNRNLAYPSFLSHFVRPMRASTLARGGRR